jgi:hypothetical protein
VALRVAAADHSGHEEHDHTQAFRRIDTVAGGRPDLTRRCPAVDPDDHHLLVSLGCAAENLVQAALAHGLQGEAMFDPAGNAVRVTLDYVIQGNAAQRADAAFVKELKAWIRFNGADAARMRDGLYSVSSGNPNIPSWIGDLAFRWLLTAKGENDKVARQVRSSAGIAVFAGLAADKARWVEVGRCYERFALQATALGLRNAFLNQPVEVAALRQPFAAALGLSGQRLDLIVRFGRGPVLPRSLRRPVEAVLV